MVCVGVSVCWFWCVSVSECVCVCVCVCMYVYVCERECVASVEGLVNKQVAPMELRPDGGSFEGHVSVRFLCQEADAVFFTTDGTDPVPFAADALAPMTGIYEPGSSTQRATPAGAGEFSSTILTSCIIKAVAATYEGGTSMSHPTSSMHAHTHPHTHARSHTHMLRLQMDERVGMYVCMS